MVEDWVVNASPLIAFGAIGRLDLLEAPDRRLVVPAAVATEVLAGVQLYMLAPLLTPSKGISNRPDEKAVEVAGVVIAPLRRGCSMT